MNHMSEGSDSFSVKVPVPTAPGSRPDLKPRWRTAGRCWADVTLSSALQIKHMKTVNIFIFRRESLDSSSELTGPLESRRFCCCCFLFDTWFCSRHWKSHETVLVSLCIISDMIKTLLLSLTERLDCFSIMDYMSVL